MLSEGATPAVPSNRVSVQMGADGVVVTGWCGDQRAQVSYQHATWTRGVPYDVGDTSASCSMVGGSLTSFVSKLAVFDFVRTLTF